MADEVISIGGKHGMCNLRTAAVLALLVRHLLLLAMHLFLVANLVTTTKALVTTSDALVPSSEPCYY